MLILYILTENYHAPVTKIAPDYQAKRGKQTIKNGFCVFHVNLLMTILRWCHTMQRALSRHGLLLRLQRLLRKLQSFLQ